MRAISRFLYFNPRSRMGSDYLLPVNTTLMFNFNPRSRMGSDPDAQHRRVHPVVISIHAPAWGATSLARFQSMMISFQSTLPHGERPSPLPG